MALLQSVLGAGPPGAYNIAADGILTTADVAREFGLIPLPWPAGPAQLAARAAMRSVSRRCSSAGRAGVL